MDDKSHDIQNVFHFDDELKINFKSNHFQIPFPAITIITEFEIVNEFRFIWMFLLLVQIDDTDEEDRKMAEDGTLLRYKITIFFPKKFILNYNLKALYPKFRSANLQ